MGPVGQQRILHGAGGGRNFGEHFVGKDAVGADSQDLSAQLYKLVVPGSHGCQFGRSDKGKITGIEKQNHPLVLEITEFYRDLSAAVISFRLKVRSRLVWFN